MYRDSCGKAQEGKKEKGRGKQGSIAVSWNIEFR
jgi:hypothetical protein